MALTATTATTTTAHHHHHHNIKHKRNLYAPIYYGDSTVVVGEPFSITCRVSITEKIQWLKNDTKIQSLRHEQNDYRIVEIEGTTLIHTKQKLQGKTNENYFILWQCLWKFSRVSEKNCGESPKKIILYYRREKRKELFYNHWIGKIIFPAENVKNNFNFNICYTWDTNKDSTRLGLYK